jgi:antirestriction protein
MDLIDSTDEVLEELAEAEIIPRDEDGEPDYGGDLLVADAEGLARAFTGSYDTFDFNDFVEARDYCASNHVDEDAVEAYLSYAGSWSKSDFEEAYNGEADSEEAFAEQLADDSGMLESIPENLRCYFDFKAFARDLFINEYWYEDGYVFRRV